MDDAARAILYLQAQGMAQGAILLQLAGRLDDDVRRDIREAACDHLEGLAMHVSGNPVFFEQYQMALAEIEAILSPPKGGGGKSDRP